MTTAAEYITDIRQIVKDPAQGDPADGTNYKDVELLVLLNEAITYIVLEIAGTWPQYFLSTAMTSTDTQNIVANQESYDLPDDFVLPLAVVADGTEMDPLSLERKFDSDADGYFLLGDKIYLYATPDENVTNGLVLYYISQQTRLTETDETVPLPDVYRPLVCRVVATLAKLRQEEDAASMAKMWERALALIKGVVTRVNVSKDDVGLRVPYRWWI